MIKQETNYDPYKIFYKKTGHTLDDLCGRDLFQHFFFFTIKD
ncbi:hypothetical protein ASZ90_003888 [hydrocarbon metagenome]|uniref:Uncharacterized protein n=1 Tax=hydrocarbon metagenome TaxID=938273 RepID=A0A0W8FZM2_9ZZZZ